MRDTHILSFSCGVLGPYLCLDAVQATAPQHMAPPHLHLRMINLVIYHLFQLLLGDLFLLRAMASRL